jgi:hypothetical protein
MKKLPGKIRTSAWKENGRKLSLLLVRRTKENMNSEPNFVDSAKVFSQLFNP